MSTTSGSFTEDATTEVHVIGDLKQRRGLVVHVSGTFNSGTFSLQFYGADDQWHDISGGSFTEAFDKILDLKPGTRVRGVLSGSSLPSIYYQMTDNA